MNRKIPYMNFTLGIILSLSVSSNSLGAEGELQKIIEKKADNFHQQLLTKAGTLIVSQIEKKNAMYGDRRRTQKDTPTDIKKLDLEWRAWSKGKSKSSDFINAVMKNACSDALRNFMKSHKEVTEIFVMDKIGTNVCAAEKTSDYDQGDEGKWITPFKDKKGKHIGDMQLDKSSKMVQIQVSTVVKSGNVDIGVITIGISTSSEIAKLLK